MAQLTHEQFRNFFRYYGGLEHQIKAIDELYDNLDTDLKDDSADWVKIYRNPTDGDANDLQAAWPITKQEMASIMGCAVSSLPDSLMDDFAHCCELYGFDRLNIGYFLGQCGHESAGLRYPLEIASGADYEFRSDLGNTQAGDGVKFAGTGWIQVTGRYWHQSFSDYLKDKGEYDAKIMEIGKTYTSEKYPWSISGFWWYSNDMITYCNQRPDVDRVGARVNGKYLPNGYEDRRHYTAKAFDVLGL